MVKAVKDGIFEEFSDRTWELTKNNRDGWQEVNDAPVEDVPVEEIKLEDKTVNKDAEIAELKAIIGAENKKTIEQKEKITALNAEIVRLKIKVTELEGKESKQYVGKSPKVIQTDVIVTVDDMKFFLKEKGVKFHHKLGDEKVKVLYHENTK